MTECSFVHATGQCTMKVFLPIQCLKECSGVLLGCIDEKRTFCCITGMLPLPVKHSHWPLLKKSSGDNPIIFGTVAAIDNIGKVDCRHFDSSRILLRIQNRDGKLAVRWNSDSKVTDSGVSNFFFVVLYNAEQFATSVFMEPNVDEKDFFPLSNVNLIKRSFALHRQFKKHKPTNGEKDFTVLRMGGVAWATALLFDLIVRIVSSVLGIVSTIASQRPLQGIALSTVLSIPAVCNHIRHKFDVTSARLKSVPISRKHRLGFISCIWLHWLDFLIGVTVMIWLLHDDKTTFIAQSLLSTAETVASELEQLLQWMMGVPAGLKLNQPFAQFLGKFFLFHIFLWKAYLKALEPFATTVLSAACLTGVLGITVQLAIVQDILSMMTLHIYCFYVYAARLFNLQVYALSSLWRVFRGKKRNVLRNRVDSAIYDVDQLFLGTLLFTILLFLLPTTALFYTVFALLRVMVLICQGILFKIVNFISSLPLYWLIIRLFQPDTISGNVHISISQHSPLCLMLELKPVPIMELYCADASTAASMPTTEIRCANRSASANNTWMNLLHKLLCGELIYPWLPAGSGSSGSSSS